MADCNDSDPSACLVARPRRRMTLPAGVCARWAAFVAEKSARAALARIVESSDALLERLRQSTSHGRVTRIEAEN